MIGNCFLDDRKLLFEPVEALNTKSGKCQSFLPIFYPGLFFSGKESNFGSRPFLRQAGVTGGGKGGLGEMDLHSRANHH